MVLGPSDYDLFESPASPMQLLSPHNLIIGEPRDSQMLPGKRVQSFVAPDGTKGIVIDPKDLQRPFYD